MLVLDGFPWFFYYLGDYRLEDLLVLLGATWSVQVLRRYSIQQLFEFTVFRWLVNVLGFKDQSVGMRLLVQRGDRDLHTVHLRSLGDHSYLRVFVLLPELGEHGRSEVLDVGVIGDEALFVLWVFDWPILFELFHQLREIWRQVMITSLVLKSLFFEETYCAFRFLDWFWLHDLFWVDVDEGHQLSLFDRGALVMLLR